MHRKKSLDIYTAIELVNKLLEFRSRKAMIKKYIEANPQLELAPEYNQETKKLWKKNQNKKAKKNLLLFDKKNLEYLQEQAMESFYAYKLSKTKK